MARGTGGKAEAWMETIDGYDYTAEIALRSVERVLRDRPVGALAPATAFGVDFALEVPGTKRLDVI